MFTDEIKILEYFSNSVTLLGFILAFLANFLPSFITSISEKWIAFTKQPYGGFPSWAQTEGLRLSSCCAVGVMTANIAVTPLYDSMGGGILAWLVFFAALVVVSYIFYYLYLPILGGILYSLSVTFSLLLSAF